jgi:arginyl-tRNA synthetase
MIKSEVVKLLESAGITLTEDKLEIPPSDEFGDISFPCFEIGKIQGKDPSQVALEIKNKIKISESSMVKKIEVKSGYVNFFFDWRKVAEKLLKEILLNKDFEKVNLGRGEVAVVDYSSPNPVHPIHIGSARSTFIGESLCRILEFVNYKVKRVFFVNDLGRQVAILLWYYLKFMKNSKPDKKEDKWLLDIYVKANEELKKYPENEIEVDDILKKCEFKDNYVYSVLKEIVDWCLNGFKKTYDTLGIKFDDYIFESDFVEKAKIVAIDLLKRNFAFTTSDNAVVINLEPYNLPNTVILRHDGTTLYLIRDVAASINKIEKYRPKLNIYVVAEDQSLHFKQEFKILELLGYESFAKNSYHLSFGYVSLPEGKMSSRIGRVVLLDDLIEESIRRVKEKFEVNDENIAKAIGIGAIVYSILKVEAKKQVLFKWEDVLNLEGNSAPYIQYAYARCCSILRKANEWKKLFYIESLNEYEEKILKHLILFVDVITRAAKEFRPDILCSYAYELASKFNTFYQYSPVLNAETEELKNFRLCLVEAVKIVLGITLDLLNIKKLEKI